MTKSRTWKLFKIKNRKCQVWFRINYSRYINIVGYCKILQVSNHHCIDTCRAAKGCFTSHLGWTSCLRSVIPEIPEIQLGRGTMPCWHVLPGTSIFENSRVQRNVWKTHEAVLESFLTHSDTNRETTPRMLELGFWTLASTWWSDDMEL